MHKSNAGTPGEFAAFDAPRAQFTTSAANLHRPTTASVLFYAHRTACVFPPNILIFRTFATRRRRQTPRGSPSHCPRLKRCRGDGGVVTPAVC